MAYGKLMGPGAIGIEIEAIDLDPALLSMRSVFLLLEQTAQSVSNTFDRIFLDGIHDRLKDVSPLIDCQELRVTTGKASLISINLVPSELYLGIVATLQRVFGFSSITHDGWPILSVDDKSKTATEKDNESIGSYGSTQ